MKLGVVVLNWNGGEVTPRCLDSLLASVCPAERIVVVDNASTDGSADLIRGRYPQVVLIENDSNLGFAEGNNVGIRYLLERGFDLVMLLNNDAVVEAQCLCKLRLAAERESAAAYGATIYELAAPEKVWYAGGTINRLTLDARHDLALHSADAQPRPIGFITGCCLMLRADALRRLGLLDKDFFAYYEDVDWCLRARAAAEVLLYVPDAVVLHEGSHSFRRSDPRQRSQPTFTWMQSPPLVLYLAYRNRLLLVRKHVRGQLHLAFLVVRRLARGALHGALLISFGRWRQARATIDGTLDGLLRPPRPLRAARYVTSA